MRELHARTPFDPESKYFCHSMIELIDTKFLSYYMKYSTSENTPSVNLIYITTNFLYPNWLDHTFHVKSTKHIYKIYDPLHLSI